MRSSPLRNSTLFLISSVLVFCAAGLAFAHQHDQHRHNAHDKLRTVMVTDGYARATFALAKTAAVYFTLHNSGIDPITLMSVDVDSSVAEDAQIHTSVMQGEMVQMREVPEGVLVKPQAAVTFESGSYHIMLLGLSKGLEEGKQVPITLHFREGVKLEIVLPVKKDGETNHHHHHKQHQ